MNNLFGDETPWCYTTESIIEKMFWVPISWVGNKKKLLKQILQFLSDNHVEFDSVFDAFAGSGVFSLAMLGEGKKVIANDALMTASTWLLTLLQYHKNPLSHLEAKSLAWPKNTDIKHHLDFFKKGVYGEVFDSSEIEFMEVYRTNVASLLGRDMRVGMVNPTADSLFKLHQDGLLPGCPDKVTFAMQAMCIQILRKCYLGGRHYKKQLLARIDQRKSRGKNEVVSGLNTNSLMYGIMKLLHQETYPTRPIADFLSKMVPCPVVTIYNMDTMELVRSGAVHAELAYFDPPYGGKGRSTDCNNYTVMYGACESFLRGEDINNCVNLKKLTNRFVNGSNYINNFKELLDASKNFPSWLFSFNDSSFESIKNIVTILKSFGRRVVVKQVDNYGYNCRVVKRLENEFIILAQTVK